MPFKQVCINHLFISIFGASCNKLTGNKFPLIVFYLIFAFIISPNVWSSYHDSVVKESSYEIGILSDLGVLIFLFTAGLENEFNKDMIRKHSVKTLSSLLITWTIISCNCLLISYLGQLTISEILPVTIIASFTATPVLILYMKKFKPLKMIQEDCMCYTIFSDFYCWTFLLVLQIIILKVDYYKPIIGVFVLILVIMILLPLHKIRWLATQMSDGGLLTVIQLGLISAVLATTFNLSIGFCALIVGSTVPKWLVSPEMVKIMAKVLENLFIPFVFIDISISMDFSSFQLVFVILLSSTSLFDRLLPASILNKFVYHNDYGVLIGIFLNCGGLVEIIASKVAFDSGLITKESFTGLTVIALWTTILTPVLTLIYKHKNPKHFDETIQVEGNELSEMGLMKNALNESDLVRVNLLSSINNENDQGNQLEVKEMQSDDLG